MTKTLLNGINDVLTRVGVVDLNGQLSSSTNAGKQTFIDLTIQLWNETIDEMCDMMGVPLVAETGSSTIALVTDTREYDLPSDLVQIRWPLVDQTNGNYLWPYPGGYEQMRIDQQIPSDWMGLPYSAAINQTTGKLRLERTPTSTENGKAYDLLYDKDLVMSSDSDTFPFADAVYRAVVPVVAEGYERKKRNDFDEDEYRKSLSRAMSFVNKRNRRTHW